MMDRRQADERMSLVMDALPALVSYVDSDCRYQFNNLAYENWFGIDRRSLVGKTMSDVLGASAFAKLKPNVEMALRGERVKFDAELPYRFGGTRFVHVDYVPDVQPGGMVSGFYVFVTDLSERQKAEAIQAQELADLALLHQMTMRLALHEEMQPMLTEMLEGAMALTGAARGTVSTLDPSTGTLTVSARRGADDAQVDERGSGPVHSTPLLSRDNRVLGRLDLHRDRPEEPSERHMRLIELLARHAAGYMEHLHLLQSAR